MNIEVVSPENWRRIGAQVHAQVFGEKISPQFDRLDYALICLDESRAVMGYLTAFEPDRDTILWQWGGVLPGARGTPGTVRGMEKLLAWSKERYCRVKFYTANQNVSMLRIALAVGFTIVGMKTGNRGQLFLELVKELKGE